MMILSGSFVSILLIHFIVFVQAQYTPQQSTINVRAVVARLNDMFGLGMNLSKIVDDFKSKHKDTYSQNEVINSVANKDSVNNQNTAYNFQSGVPIKNQPNQYAGAPQNNGFSFQNKVANNMPNQVPPMSQNGYFDGQGRNLQVDGGFMPQNLQNKFAAQPNQYMNGFGQQISGGGAQNGGSFGMNSNSQFMNGFGQPNDRFLSQNAIPNNLPNQLAPKPQNDGSLINTGNNPLQISGGGPQNGAPLGMNSNNQFMNGFGQPSNGFLSQNQIPNNLPNQLAPKPQNDGSLINTGNNRLQIPGGVPLNGGPLNFGQLNGNVGSIPQDMLSKHFGPLSQNSMNLQNGLFNGMPLPRGFMNNGMNSMSANSFGNNVMGNPNLNNPQASLFNIFQQSANNQMGGNIPSNQNSYSNFAQNDDTLFKKTIDRNYNGVSNFNDPNALDENMGHKNFNLKNPQQNLQQELLQQQNQPAQQQTQNQIQQNEEVDAFIKRMLGQDVFDYAKKELKFKDETIGKNQYPATEESLFKRVTDDNYEGITNEKYATVPTINYKLFNILKHPDEPIESVKKKIMLQNEWVKADKNKLEAYFKDIKKDKEDRERDEMYGRVKRGLIIDENVDSKNDKTTRRTHIYEDIQLGLKQWVNFGRKELSEENVTNNSTNENKGDKKRSKRALMNQCTHNELDYDKDEELANFAKMKTEGKNQFITDFLDYCDRGKHDNNNDFLHKLHTHQRYKRDALDDHEDKDEVLANFANMKTEGKSKLITNFLDYCDEKNDFNNHFNHAMDNNRDMKQHRHKRELLFRGRDKYDFDRDGTLAEFANMKMEGKNPVITNFFDYIDQEKEKRQENSFHKLEALKNTKEKRLKREAISFEKSHDYTDKFVGHHERIKDIRDNLNNHNEIADFSDENLASYLKSKKETQNKIVNEFLNYFDEAQADENEIKRKKMQRFKRQLSQKNYHLERDQERQNIENEVPRKLFRQKRQTKSNDDLNLVSNDLLKKAQKLSRMQYNEIFPEILKDFETFRESTYVKSLRKAYRSNGWPAMEFKAPENPRDVLPQVFRHFKYISKTNLEEFYFIMMLRLPKLIKLYRRTLNIVDRGFKEPTNGQLQEYTKREYDIEKDFADFSKILRSKIFNAYLDFEDRYNEESPKFFMYETMPPFNKDPTAPPEMEKFKETGLK